MQNHPLSLSGDNPKEVVIFAWGQRQGERPKQEDSFANFRDECFVVADGVGGLPQGDVAAKLAVETAIWGYKHIRLRPFYWRDKRLFLRRIFRSANLTLWQKQREKEFSAGMATTLLVTMVGARTFWLGSAGDTSAFLYRETLIDKLTREDVDEEGYLVKALGVGRKPVIPQFVSETFLPGDILVLATDGISNYLDEEQFRQTLDSAGNTTSELQKTVNNLLDQAGANGSPDNMTVCLIKRLQTLQDKDFDI